MLKMLKKTWSLISKLHSTKIKIKNTGKNIEIMLKNYQIICDQGLRPSKLLSCRFRYALIYIRAT
jgi:hypothetical protein